VDLHLHRVHFLVVFCVVSALSCSTLPSDVINSSIQTSRSDFKLLPQFLLGFRSDRPLSLRWVNSLYNNCWEYCKHTTKPLIHVDVVVSNKRTAQACAYLGRQSHLTSVNLANEKLKRWWKRPVYQLNARN